MKLQVSNPNLAEQRFTDHPEITLLIVRRNTSFIHLVHLDACPVETPPRHRLKHQSRSAAARYSQSCHSPEPASFLENLQYPGAAGVRRLLRGIENQDRG